VAKLAAKLGHAADRDAFAARSRHHRNLYDAGSGFLRPRKVDGTWMSPFDPLCCALGTGKYQGPGYAEGTAWQYLFMVPHDVAGLKRLLGGDAAFVARLNEAFTPGGGYYSLINQPDMLYPYLYTHVPGQAWRTQARVRQDIAANFSATRAGLPGNDDAGQTSSRLFFDMLGFYPADPLSGAYQIGSPVFPRAAIELDQRYYPGARFVVAAENTSGASKHVRSATLNGAALETPHLAHAAITAGGTLSLVMDSVPSSWGR
jgi:predicted alpha-1,2-mannosidase